MIYRDQVFFGDRVIRLLAHPFPPTPVSKLPLFLSLPVNRRSSLLTGGGGGGGGDDDSKLYDNEKAWPFIISVAVDQDTPKRS